ncbi:MAG: hypothetical protein ACSLE1_08995 [Sphingobium sp.]
MGAPGRLRYLFYSVVIAGVLGAQAVASFGNTDRYFPFLWYPMYAKAHFIGERLDVGHTIYAVTADGLRHPVNAEDLKIDFWRFERKFARPLVAGKADEIAPFVRLIAAQYPSLTALQVDDYPMIITRDGPAPAPLRTVATLSRAAFQAQLQ